MKVFVSHSMRDRSLLEGLSNSLVPHGITLLIAEHEIDLQNAISIKIKRMIDNCDIGLILLTKHGLESGFVREEIGYLEAKNKASLIVFEKGVKNLYGGFKYGHDYIELEPDDLENAVDRVKQVLLRHYNKMLENKRLIALQEEKAIRERNNVLIGLGILAGLFILGSSE